MNNFVSADVDGNIAYRTVGRIPVPSSAWGRSLGDPWTSGRASWPTTICRVVEPGRRLIVTANQRIVAPDYPHYLGVDYARTDRHACGSTSGSTTPDATVDDMAAVHRDRAPLAADVWVTRLVELAPTMGGSGGRSASSRLGIV